MRLNRLDLDLAEPLKEAVVEVELGRLLLDPLGEVEPVLVHVLDGVLLGDASDEERANAGEFLLGLLEKNSPDLAEKLLGDIAKLKWNASLPPHRHAIAWGAYAKLQGELGRDPSKIELKRYILGNPGTFGEDWPDEESSQWSRVWEAIGLKPLSGARRSTGS